MIEIYGNKLKVTETMEDYILRKLDLSLLDDTYTKVEIFHNKKDDIAVKVFNSDIILKEERKDFYEACDIVLDKFNKLQREYNKKIVDKKDKEIRNSNQKRNLEVLSCWFFDDEDNE